MRWRSLSPKSEIIPTSRCSREDEIEDASSWSQIGLHANSAAVTRQVVFAGYVALGPLTSYLPSSPYHSPALMSLGDKMEMIARVPPLGSGGVL
jgi:hypothetical protein